MAAVGWVAAFGAVADISVIADEGGGRLAHPGGRIAGLGSVTHVAVVVANHGGHALALTAVRIACFTSVTEVAVVWTVDVEAEVRFAVGVVEKPFGALAAGHAREAIVALADGFTAFLVAGSITVTGDTSAQILWIDGDSDRVGGSLSVLVHDLRGQFMNTRCELLNEQLFSFFCFDQRRPILQYSALELVEDVGAFIGSDEAHLHSTVAHVHSRGGVGRSGGEEVEGGEVQRSAERTQGGDVGVHVLQAVHLAVVEQNLTAVAAEENFNFLQERDFVEVTVREAGLVLADREDGKAVGLRHQATRLGIRQVNADCSGHGEPGALVGRSSLYVDVVAVVNRESSLGIRDLQSTGLGRGEGLGCQEVACAEAAVVLAGIRQDAGVGVHDDLTGVRRRVHRFFRTASAAREDQRKQKS